MRHSRPRTRGPKPSPVGRLTPEFRRAVRTSGTTMTTLATCASFPKLSHLSPLLHADTVAMTPIVVERLRKLAEVINFRGDVFEVGR